MYKALKEHCSLEKQSLLDGFNRSPLLLKVLFLMLRNPETFSSSHLERKFHKVKTEKSFCFLVSRVDLIGMEHITTVAWEPGNGKDLPVLLPGLLSKSKRAW